VERRRPPDHLSQEHPLDVSIPASDVAAAGTAQISVASPAPGRRRIRLARAHRDGPTPASAPASRQAARRRDADTTPAPTPSPAPVRPRRRARQVRVPPRGFLDSVGPSGAWGWAADGDRRRSDQVVLVVDGVDMVTLTTISEPGRCRGLPNFTAPARFFSCPSCPLRDGRTHQLRAYALDDDGVTRVELNQSPMAFAFAAPGFTAPATAAASAPAPAPGPDTDTGFHADTGLDVGTCRIGQPPAGADGRSMDRDAEYEGAGPRCSDVCPRRATEWANPLSLYAYSGAASVRSEGCGAFSSRRRPRGHAGQFPDLPPGGWLAAAAALGPSPAPYDKTEGLETYQATGALRARHTFAALAVGTRNGSPPSS